MTPDPYRARLLAPPSVEAFTSYLERRRRALRAASVGVFAAAVIPAALVAIHASAAAGQKPVLPSEIELSSTVSTRDEPWGLFVSSQSARTWLGPLPVLAPRPAAAPNRTGESSLRQASFYLKPQRTERHFDADFIQRHIEAHAAPLIRQCYAVLEGLHPEYGDLSGVLVASVLVLHDGTSRAGVGGDGRLISAGINRCVTGALSTLQFPAPGPDPVWFHLPIRFVDEPAED